MTDITVLDERGRMCPLPVIALGRALRALPGGSEVALLADDPVVRTDVPAWCAMVGAHIIECVESDDALRFVIRLP